MRFWGSLLGFAASHWSAAAGLKSSQSIQKYNFFNVSYKNSGGGFVDNIDLYN
jgi:hypothetical protein